MKITSLSLLLLLNVQITHAQSNFFKWSIALSGGPNFSKTDVVNGNWGRTYSGAIDFHYNPFITAGLEVQKGMIQGGDIATDPFNRQFVNQYAGVNLNVKLMLGAFINYEESNFWYHLKGLYLGTGLGVIKNNITDIVRYKPSWAAFDPGYGPYPGKDKSNSIWVPLNLGLNYYFKDKFEYIRYAININAQSNFTFGEGLDGYNDTPTRFQNYDPDTYNAYTIGVKYFFGNLGVYRKTL
ncbi:hypothetical protein [Pedobacter mucosus]|uniref:hypothetical protein n=1 Tax=Pedobacter mucosus TaxID=2895286 RepID=UPI001EE49FAA|nr:hypothetical protein [Pedobacter mucosus]UKT63607.1 hypothetical protein LOK61_17790 [Pedobacter mucosus]